jgi:hypothetical protein
MLVEICHKMGASTYVAQHAASKYLDPLLFDQAGIKLQFFKSPALVYPQLWGAFIANLSTFDLLFNCGPRSHAILTSA